VPCQYRSVEREPGWAEGSAEPEPKRPFAVMKCCCGGGRESGERSGRRPAGQPFLAAPPQEITDARKQSCRVAVWTSAWMLRHCISEEFKGFARNEVRVIVEGGNVTAQVQ
jgi:hypothetical protein